MGYAKLKTKVIIVRGICEMGATISQQKISDTSFFSFSSFWNRAERKGVGISETANASLRF